MVEPRKAYEASTSKHCGLAHAAVIVCRIPHLAFNLSIAVLLVFITLLHILMFPFSSQRSSLVAW
jgi:hypothetical protein